MPDIHFPALDLNLLRVFDALAEEASVTRAGARLGLTQSAISHALGRLRRLLDDELFVRGPHGMRPTARAREIAPRVRQGLHQLQVALTPASFMPADTRRRFTIAAGTYVCATLIPVAAALIRREAPGVELRITGLDAGVADHLQTGRVDLAIAGFSMVSPRFEKTPLIEETSVWALRADHPAASGNKLTLETLAGVPHIILASADEDRAVDGRIMEGGLERRVIWDDGGVLDEILARRGLSRSIGLVLQDALSALAAAGRTNMAALVPRRLAQALAGQYGLKLFEAPYASPPAVIEMLWRRDLTTSAPLEWLRGRLQAAAADL
ncbi:MAG: LysR family transcriptional regulator [Caulobacteraceae bacterium]|nr:LysR family transcriptional regulator [Caulobacteraceae bacterium]